MPAFLEDKLKRTASKKGFTGRRAAAYVYGTLNRLGAMHSSVETQKGRDMEAKHNALVELGTAKKAKR